MLTKYGIPAIAALALAFAMVSVARLRPVDAKFDPPLPPPAADFERKVGAVGLIEASRENIAVSLPVPGLTAAVYVKAGDRVAKGQKLFSLDDRDVRAELALRESNLELAKAKLERLMSSPRPEEIPAADARVKEAEAQLSDARVQLQMIESVRDKRAIRAEDLERRRRAVQVASARVDEAKAALHLLEAGAWSQDIEVANAEVRQAVSQVDRVRADLARLTVVAPIAGEVLQCKVRPGEYAAAGPLAQPLILLGSTDRLHVRADVDERDAPRVKPGARAIASVRGDARRKFPLHFVSFEPFVVPKKNLTTDATERVDTRVLQVIYALDRGAPVLPGQQMDVLIEAN
ncbi:MAG: efflux RND transporter periplasmic adaptor subunit [Acidobacteria bacterium]|nr:efflux RND transporter periplasmic adaptor subunit [Acidobacteriota bacterium]